MITTKQLAEEIGIKEVSIRARIVRLGLTPARIGHILILTPAEAKAVRAAKNKPGPEPTSASGRGRNGHKKQK